MSRTHSDVPAGKPLAHLVLPRMRGESKVQPISHNDVELRAACSPSSISMALSLTDITLSRMKLPTDADVWSPDSSVNLMEVR